MSDLFEIFPAEIGYDRSIGHAHSLKRVSRYLNAFAPPTTRPTGWRWRVAPYSSRTLNLRPIDHMTFEPYGRFSLGSHLSWTRNILNTFGLRGVVYISRKRARVGSFKRSSEMTRARKNKYANPRLTHREKSRNSPDSQFYNVAREVSRPIWVQNPSHQCVHSPQPIFKSRHLQQPIRTRTRAPAVWRDRRHRGTSCMGDQASQLIT